MLHRSGCASDGCVKVGLAHGARAPEPDTSGQATGRADAPPWHLHPSPASEAYFSLDPATHISDQSRPHVFTVADSPTTLCEGVRVEDANPLRHFDAPDVAGCAAHKPFHLLTADDSEDESEVSHRAISTYTGGRKIRWVASSTNGPHCGGGRSSFC